MAKQDLSRFLNHEGQLIQWPAKHVDKAQAIRYLATKFNPHHSYTEREVNELLEHWHNFGDWPLLRRELFESGYLDRLPDGSNYQLTDKLAKEAY